MWNSLKKCHIWCIFKKPTKYIWFSKKAPSQTFKTQLASTINELEMNNYTKRTIMPSITKLNYPVWANIDRFELPLDMTVLEDMMPMDYLARFVSVSSSRRQLYNKVFVRFRSLKDSMLNEEVCKNRWSCHYILIGYIIDTPNCLLTIFRQRYLLWSWWWALPLTPIFKINSGRLWVSFSKHMSQSSSITRSF